MSQSPQSPTQSDVALASGDELLREGARLIQAEHAERDEAWARYSAGDIDRAQLPAALGEQLSSADIELGARLFEPLSADRLQSLTDALASTLDDGAQHRAPSTGAVIELSSRPGSPPAASPEADSQRGQPRSTWWLIGSLAAVAAAIVSVWFLIAREPSESSSPSVARLSNYTLTTDAGSAATRADPDTLAPPSGPIPYSPGDHFGWALVPDDSSSVAPALRLFVFDSDASTGRELPAELLEPLLEARGAALRVKGPIDALTLAPGRSTIALVMAAEPSGLPTSLSRAQLSLTDEAWRAFVVEVQLSSAEPRER